MKVLFLTQKVDKEDDILGFFHLWLEKFGPRFDFINVICLEMGGYSLPQNVKIWSLGKETGRIKIKYLIRFYRYIWKLRREYDAVFVHMNPIYVVLGGVFWKLWKKKIYLWHNHRYGNLITKLAIQLADRVFYTSPFAFSAKFEKSKIMPAGIDAEFFIRDIKIKKIPNSILYLGRISPIKYVDVLIRALVLLDAERMDFVLNIVGEPGEKEKEYFKEIKNLARNLEIKGKIKFLGKVSNYMTPASYNRNELFVNLSPAGSFDKTILEAMACETLVVVSNESFSGVLPDYLIFPQGDFKALAERMRDLLRRPEEEKRKIGESLRKIAVENHSLKNLINKICGFLT